MNLYFWGMRMIDGIYLLIGTNLGDKKSNINTALQKIAMEVGVITAKSSVYETAAWGKLDQPSFYNIAVRVSSEKNPFELLDALQAIEKDMGRIRVEKWRERLIDIDILYYEDLQINTPELTVPHPELPNRRFALIPLVEIADSFVHPALGKSNTQLLQECKDILEVKKVN